MPWEGMVALPKQVEARLLVLRDPLDYLGWRIFDHDRADTDSQRQDHCLGDSVFIN
jgi:hypothetical protein